jgi:hypothetical protein
MLRQSGSDSTDSGAELFTFASAILFCQQRQFSGRLQFVQFCYRAVRPITQRAAHCFASDSTPSTSSLQASQRGRRAGQASRESPIDP